MAVTRFESQIVASSVGTADVDKVASSFEKLAASIDNAGKKGESVNKLTFDKFGESVKSGIEDPLGAASGAVEGLLKGLGPIGVGIAAGGVAIAGMAVAGFDAARSLGLL